ncbi:DUF2919 domain-containing protein [Ferrimonas gelatinilytica]|uniref:DUF2919 domain-containing protein n=1 Tax=Ferrimonas gelatinilytica TaxID=1255257 RepID=A0ABP9S0C9_9GAMM
MTPLPFPPHRLTDHGWVNPSPWLYLLMLFLARTWLLLTVAAVSRRHGSDLLGLFYPQQRDFYLGLALGLVPMLLLWLQGQRHRWALAGRVWQWGWWLMLLVLLLDLALQGSSLYRHHGTFSWGPATVLMLSVWSLWYLLRSPDCRRVFHLKGELEGGDPMKG